ncbi:MAG: proteasome accessory factor PafA2 family protein, partial [Chthoniobacterales bacterium]
RDPTRRWIVELENGRTVGALDVQWQLQTLAARYFGGRDEETDWLLESWSYTLDALPNKPEALLGGVDWISKKWLLETFMAAENLSWNDLWLQSLDLEYHNIDPARGLFFGLTPAKRIGEWNNLVRQKDVTHTPPCDTRASGRAHAVAAFRKEKRPYVINWDSIACESHDFLVMGDPFQTYVDEIEQFIQTRRRANPAAPGK